MMPYEIIYTLNGSERDSLSGYDLGVYVLYKTWSRNSAFKNGLDYAIRY